MSQQQVFEDLSRRIGEEVHLSDWFEVTQERINAFADATGDHQWIHVDVERAGRESPWRSTIAHGYLTLSLYPMLRGLVATGPGHLSGREAGHQLRPRQAAISERCPGRQPRPRPLQAAQGRGSAGRPAVHRTVHGGDRGPAEARLRRRGDHAAVFR